MSAHPHLIILGRRKIHKGDAHSPFQHDPAMQDSTLFEVRFTYGLRLGHIYVYVTDDLLPDTEAVDKLTTDFVIQWIEARLREEQQEAADERATYIEKETHDD